MNIKNNFCIVGYGNHAKSKILPAILKINKNKIYIVSNKKIKRNKRIVIFNSIDKAISQLEKNVIFIIVTPPNSHYLILKKLLINGFSALVEKPILLYSYQNNNLSKIIKNNFYFECFMYKYNYIYKHLEEYFTKNNKNIDFININFLIPKLNYSSFRDLKKNKYTTINDMACYAVSLINELNIKIKYIKILEVKKKFQNNKENIKILFQSYNYKIIFKTGYSHEYKNDIKIILNNGNSILFEKIFYGINSVKKIYYNNINKTNIVKIKENNSFEKMFNIKKNDLKKCFSNNYNIINKNTKMLENLRKQYNTF